MRVSRVGSTDKIIENGQTKRKIDIVALVISVILKLKCICTYIRSVKVSVSVGKTKWTKRTRFFFFLILSFLHIVRCLFFFSHSVALAECTQPCTSERGAHAKQPTPDDRIVSHTALRCYNRTF